jgi:hypothetical protein
LGGVHNVFHVS